jgi:hypothetical protein
MIFPLIDSGWWHSLKMDALILIMLVYNLTYEESSFINGITTFPASTYLSFSFTKVKNHFVSLFIGKDTMHQMPIVSVHSSTLNWCTSDAKLYQMLVVCVCIYILNTHFSYVDFLLQSIHLIYDLHSCVCYLLSLIYWYYSCMQTQFRHNFSMCSVAKYSSLIWLSGDK